MTLVEDKERSNVIKKRKKSKGRQKIDIKKIQKADQRQVTFSKRRTGLFKKAGELSVLCGGEMAVIVFSEGSKPYTFGHPNADLVVEKYLNGGKDSREMMMMSMMMHCSSSAPSDSLTRISPFLNNDLVLYSNESKAHLNLLNRCYLDAGRELEEERRKGKSVAEGTGMSCGNNNNNGLYLWEESIEGMCLEELEEYLKAMHDMRAKIVDQLKDVMWWQEISVLED